MHSKWQALALSAGLGAVTGMRSFTGLAVASWHLSRKSHTGSGKTISTLRSPHVRYPLTVLAAGELVLDKTSIVGSRTDPPALFGRASIGALCGVMVADVLRTEKATSAAVGATAAVASTFFAYHVRKAVGEQLPIPDWFVALAEDAKAVAGASALMRILTNGAR